MSSAISADSTALPRSMSTTTPSPSSAVWMASTMAVASVPNVVASRPAATAIRTWEPCSISDASATAESARARLWDTTTSPVTTSLRWPGPAPTSPAGRLRSLPDPDVPRCARRDTTPGPCAPAWGWSRRDPTPQHRRLGPSASSRPTPSAIASSSASQAGARASYIVLSPACARPRATTPSSPARSAAANCDGIEGVLVARAPGHAQEEGAVQRSAGAAHGADERHPRGLEELAGSRSIDAVEGCDDGIETTVEIGSVVGVADGRVELSQELTVVRDLLCERHEPSLHRCCIDHRRHIPKHHVVTRPTAGQAS